MTVEHCMHTMDCIYTVHVHYVTLYLALVSSSAEECRTILGGGGRALLGLLPGALAEYNSHITL